MVFYESTELDITESLPTGLGGGTLEAAAYPADFGWDVMIGSLGFRLRISERTPYRRETEQFRKQQFDASDEAGEQSLGPWWIRSQASWHGGSGIKWYEPGAEPETAYRFANSLGVDPWTRGEYRLLRRMEDLHHVNERVFARLMAALGAESFVMSATEPADPAVGDIWANSGDFTIRRWDGDSWVLLEGSDQEIAAMLIGLAGVPDSGPVVPPDLNLSGPTYVVSEDLSLVAVSETGMVVATVPVYEALPSALRDLGMIAAPVSWDVVGIDGPLTDLSQPAYDGKDIWVGHSGGIVKIHGGGADQPWDSSGPVKVWWVKSRLVAAVGNKLFELAPGDTGTVESDGSLLYEHPLDTWEWVAVAETAGAVLAAGRAGGTSAIFRFRLEEQEGVLEWTSAEQVAALPTGEVVTCMGTYLGSFVVLGTNYGVRVGQVNAGGDVQYGPWTLETPGAKTLTFRDRFAYVAVERGLPDGTSGLARIDLSGETEAGTYPWAWDVSMGHDGPIYSVATLMTTDRVVIGGHEHALVQSESEYVDEGWLDTGQIRYRTVEPKVFRLFTLNAELNGGEVQVTAFTPDRTEHRVFTFTKATGVSDDALIRLPQRQTNTHLTFRTYLRPPGGDTTRTPVVTGYQVKAVPAPERVELIQYPVSLFDREVDRHGNEWTQENGGYLRFAQLKLLESTGVPQRITDARTGETFVGSIERVEFIATAPPDRNSGNFGGVGLVTVRRL